MSHSPLPTDGWSPDVYDRLTTLLDLPHGEHPHLAVLDWDDTVIAGDLSLAMLRRSDARQGTRWHDSYYELLRDHGRPVAYPQVARWYAGWTPDDFRAFADEVIVDALRTGDVAIREPMQSLIDALLARDWHVRVVTASPELLVARMAPHLGLAEDHVLGMRLVVAEDGTMVDTLDGPPTFAEGKRTVIEQHLGRPPTLVAGDSSSDLPMMEFSEHVLLIDGHDATLRDLAHKRGWMVQGGWHHTRAEPGVPTT